MFKEFALSFGRKLGENEMGPPQLRFKPTYLPGQSNFDGFGKALGSTLAAAEYFGRWVFRPLSISANRSECAYGLRFVEWNNRGDYKWDGRVDYKTPYSVRQSAVYHRRKLDGTSTWILIAASNSTESRLKEYLQVQQNSKALNPFEPHILLLDSALANRRQYLIWLTEETNEQVLQCNSIKCGWRLMA